MKEFYTGRWLSSLERTASVFGGKTTYVPTTPTSAREPSSRGNGFGRFNSTLLSPKLHITMTPPRVITSQCLSSSNETSVCPGPPSFKEGDRRRSPISLRYHSSISSCDPSWTSSQFSFDRRKVSAF